MKEIFLLLKQIENTYGDKHGLSILIGLCVMQVCILYQEITPENSLTFADLSSVQSISDLINEIIDYSQKNPHFINQIAWVHASKAISQKWPCK